LIFISAPPRDAENEKGGDEGRKDAPLSPREKWGAADARVLEVLLNGAEGSGLEEASGAIEAVRF